MLYMIKKIYDYDFSIEKNKQIMEERGISFEEIIAALENGQLLDIIINPNTELYAHQKIFVLNINEYIYLVPFVYKNPNEIFLKTIFPSRKLTKRYLNKQENKNGH